MERRARLSFFSWSGIEMFCLNGLWHPYGFLQSCHWFHFPRHDPKYRDACSPYWNVRLFKYSAVDYETRFHVEVSGELVTHEGRGWKNSVIPISVEVIPQRGRWNPGHGLLPVTCLGIASPAVTSHTADECLAELRFLAELCFRQGFVEKLELCYRSLMRRIWLAHYCISSLKLAFNAFRLCHLKKQACYSPSICRVIFWLPAFSQLLSNFTFWRPK